jgi:uncharacterized protein involved in exopolysaccharide biosynthesis
MKDDMNEEQYPELPRESTIERSTELIARTAYNSGPEEIVGLYQHTPGVFDITLRDLLDVLKNRRLYLVIGLVAGVELAMLMLVLTTPLFAVSAQLVITQQAPGQLIDTDSGSSAFIATQAEVLHSPTVVREAVASLPRPSYLDPESDAVASALEAVNASAITGTRVIALAYLGADPNYGADLLNSMVDVYLAQVRDSTQTDQANLLDTQDAELDQLLNEIAEAEALIKELRQKNAIIGTADEAASAQAMLVAEQVQALTVARSKRIELESRFATGGGGIVEQDPLRRSLREELRQAESELAIARETLTYEHPAVVAAERNVQVLQAQLKSSVGASQYSLRQQIDEATRLEKELALIEEKSRKRLEVVESHRREENKLLIALARMQSQADQWRRQLFDQRLIASLARKGDVGIGARLIEKPVVPKEPVWPKDKLVLVAGGIFGLVIAVVLALISLRRQQRNAEIVEL